jgi:hypothetical protein
MSYSAFDIVVGDRNGTSSYIRFGGKSIAAKMHHDNPLSSEQARSFWILVRTGPLCNALVVGHGDEVFCFHSSRIYRNFISLTLFPHSVQFRIGHNARCLGLRRNSIAPEILFICLKFGVLHSRVRHRS